MRPTFIVFALGLATQPASSGNLVVNGDARSGTQGWNVQGVATVEEFGSVMCFTVRSNGSFHQVVEMPANAAGGYVALVARGEAERINGLDGSITGLPYLYAMPATADRHHFLDHWQGQRMLGRPEQPADWVVMSGIYRVPKGTAYVILQLNQAERRDSPQDGSAARFADVQMRLFPSEAAARGFVHSYSSR
jgi:hypothetical protein